MVGLKLLLLTQPYDPQHRGHGPLARRHATRRPEQQDSRAEGAKCTWKSAVQTLESGYSAPRAG